jgi:lysyl endopeptidase
MRSRTLAAFAGIALGWVGLPPVAQGQTPVGYEIFYSVSSPDPYPAGTKGEFRWVHRVVSPGATFLRLHFDRFDLPEGDFVTVSSADGKELWRYDRRGPLETGEFWTFAVSGEVAVVAIHDGGADSKAAARGHGFVVDRIAHGTADLAGNEIEVVCGSDGREDAACHAVHSNPVVNLLFQVGGQSLSCTGWLVAGSNANTLITNNHCVKNQAEVNTVQAVFNYRNVACNGASPAASSTFSGKTFLKTHAGLDYTLLTLNGNPEVLWGEYIPTTKTPAVGMLINIPQHPDGRLRELGYWEDSGHTTRCAATNANTTYSGYTASSQMGYGCDTEGGSSGSPVIEAATGRVIGLHHLGNVSTSTCRNGGTQMKNICANAGALLKCQSSAACVPDGGVDDTLSETSCCSGVAVSGSTVCLDPADYGNTWASCSHICGTAQVGGCIPSGGTDDILSLTSCCSFQSVPGSAWCLDPTDYGVGWESCVQTCL